MNKKKALSSGELYRKYGIVIIMIILFVASAVINHNFLKPQNLLNILKQISVVTIIACGETMLIVSGMIDLSAGFLCTTSACVSAGVLASTGHLSLALLVGIVIGCVCGWINGFLITYYKLQPFIATLAMTYVLKGIVQIYTNGQTIGGVNKARFLGHGSILGIPVPVLIMLLSVIVIAVLMKSKRTENLCMDQSVYCSEFYTICRGKRKRIFSFKKRWVRNQAGRQLAAGNGNRGFYESGSCKMVSK